MNIFEKIKTAVDRNIVVYDMDAFPGMLTKRLLALISTCMRYNNMYDDPESGQGSTCQALSAKCTLHTIIVDKSIELDPDVIDMLTLDSDNKTKIKVEFADFDLNKYYTSLDASFPYEDKQIILAIADISRDNKEFREEYLMGSC